VILGLGVDVVEIARIARAMERLKERFARRILRPEETRGHLTPTYVAGRFAAKEALVKALGTGFTQGIGFHDFAVVSTPSGAPQTQLFGAAHARLMQLGGTAVHLSISHSREHAVAMAIVEGATRPPAPDFWPEIG
jgi:holo-[acyl-carrier protein] synthase